MAERRKCRICGRVDEVTAMEYLGRLPSKPGWCGGPRQGGGVIYVHAECVVAEAKREAEHKRKVAECHAAAKGYLNECKVAGVEPDPKVMAELLFP